MSTKLNYLITDADGVIFDRMPAILEAFAKAMLPLGINEKQVISYVLGSLGAPFESQVKGMVEQAGKTISDDDIRQTRCRFWETFDDNDIKLFPGIKDTLDNLKASGIGILVSTGSRTAEIEQLFAEFDLPHDLILGSDEILKGDEHINVFAGHFSMQKTDFCRQAAFIGDGTVDMEIAARNGIYGIGITNSIAAAPLLAAGAKAIVADFGEIIKLLR